MFELSVLNGFKTVGAFILYQDTLAFMIGPDNSGEKLGITRLGGHIEENENLLQSLIIYTLNQTHIEIWNILKCFKYHKSMMFK